MGKEQKLNINLSPEMAEGKYANLAIIAHSPSEFILDFVRVMPGVPQANVASRIILAPEHAKRLLGALQENIVKYEQQYGPINMHGNTMVGEVPMSFGAGEA